MTTETLEKANSFIKKIEIKKTALNAAQTILNHCCYLNATDAYQLYVNGNGIYIDPSTTIMALNNHIATLNSEISILEDEFAAL
jgi:hypothetical protein